MAHKISTTISTGDNIMYNSTPAKVGIYTKGLIKIHLKINDNSCCTIELSTRKVNQLIKNNTITKN